MKVTRRQARALLYRLGALSGRVSRDALMLLLWPDAAESSARRRLTRLLSYLRSALPNPGVLSADPSAVWLVPELFDSDVLAFVSLLETRTESNLEDAVRMVRGPFLDGFSLPDSSEYDLWLTTKQQRFERQYLAALADLLTMKTASADYEAAIQYGQRYLGVDELAEDIHRQLIMLYAATGQRNVALMQFERCMVALERELGVAPLPETRAAYEAARDGLAPQSATTDTKPQWSTLPGLDLPLIGRERAWEELEQAYRRLGQGGVLLVSGVAGVGKSRLMQAFASSQDALVLTGNSQGEGQTVAYQPLVQALRLALALPHRWRHTAPIWLTEAARLLPELPERFPQLPPAVEVEAHQAQSRLFEALVNLFLGLAVDGPLLLCLDDVHWADEATLGWLQYASARLEGSGICLLATYREDEAGALAGWRRRLSRARLGSEIRLAGLAADAVQELLRQAGIQASVPEALAARLHASTGGNAFFLMETIRELMESGHTDEIPDELPLPSAVRDAVLRRAARLTPLSRQVLEVASVISPRLSLGLVGEVAGRDEMRTADSLDELTGRQMLSAAGNGLRFQHDLARRAIYENISVWRRRLLHERAALALTKLRSRSEGDLAEIAFHFRKADRAAEAVGYYRKAADLARSVFAHAEAAAYLERAIALTSEAGGDVAHWPELHEALGDSLLVSGAFARAETAYRTALASIAERDPLRRAGLEAKLAAVLTPQERAEEAEQTFRAALARLARPPAEARRQWQTARLDILLGLMDALYFRLLSKPMEELAQMTAELLDEVGTVAQKSGFLSRLNQVAFIENRYLVPDENIGRAQAALALAKESGDARLLARQQFHLGFQCLWHGQPAEAREWLVQSVEGAEALGDSWMKIQGLVYLSIAYRFLSRPEDVAALLGDLQATARQAGNTSYIGAGQTGAAWLHYRAGEWRRAASAAEEALSTWQQGNYPLQWLAHWIVLAVALHDGRLQRASEAAVAMLEPTQQRLPAEMAGLLAAAVEAWEAGDKPAARHQMDQAAELARQAGYL